MAAACASVPVASVVRDMKITVRITGLRVLAVRLWIGSRLMRLGARIIGCQLTMERD